MDKDIGVGIMVGILISLGFLIYDLIKKARHKSKNKDYYKNKKEVDEINSKIYKIESLYEQGILTDSEFQEKSAKLKAKKLKLKLKLTEEYKKLKSLYDDKILTKEEFDKKVESLIIQLKNKKQKSKKKKIKNLFNNNFKLSEHTENSFETKHDKNIIINFNKNGTTTLSNGKYSIEGKFFQKEDLLKLEYKNIRSEFKFINREWNLKYKKQGFILTRSPFNKKVELKFKVI